MPDEFGGTRDKPAQMTEETPEWAEHEGRDSKPDGLEPSNVAEGDEVPQGTLPPV